MKTPTDVITKEEYDSLPPNMKGEYTLPFAHKYPSGHVYKWISRNPVTKDIWNSPARSVGILVQEGWG